MKPDLVITERAGSVMLKRQVTNWTERCFIFGLTFFVVAPLSVLAASDQGVSLLWKLSFAFVIFTAPIAIWWACTYSWTIRCSGAICKEVGPFSSNDFVKSET